MTSAAHGITGALDYLATHPKAVQPDLDRVSYFGHSFGAVITANLANRYESMSVPRPRAIFLDDLHDGGIGARDEPALDDSMTGIPSENKALVLTYPDAHGQPALSSAHGVCSAREGEADAYDWEFCWKVWDSLQAAAYDGADRKYALGDTIEHTNNGTWSDGEPVTSLKVQTAGPIRP